MAYKNRFHKTTLGVDAQVFVAKAVAYTDDTTLKDFQANAVEGEVAIINAETSAVITTAPAAGTKVFIALKRDGNVETSSPFVLSGATKRKNPYVAPVKHGVTVTTTGAPAELVVGDLKFQAKTAGTAGNSITITVVDPAGNNAALSVAVVGTAITINLATDGSSNPTSTATLVKAAMDASTAASALVSTTITGTAATVQAAASVANLAGGVAQPTVVKGDQLELAIIETTPGMQPLPSTNYMVEVRTGETFQDAIVRLVALINNATSIENADRTLIVDASVVNANNILLTAKNFGEHFKVALRGLFVDNASAAVSTQFKLGSGYYESVLLAEQAGDIRKGVTTNYPDQNAVPAEFGAPTSFVSSSNTYNSYLFDFFSEDQTRTLSKEVRRNYIFLFSPSNGTNPTSALDTILGT